MLSQIRWLMMKQPYRSIIFQVMKDEYVIAIEAIAQEIATHSYCNGRFCLSKTITPQLKRWRNFGPVIDKCSLLLLKAWY
jgi:hypothetical protein